MELSFHPLIRRDLRSVLNYYAEEGGLALAGQFYEEFRKLASEVGKQFTHFHFFSGPLRHANFGRFPYHLPFRETS